MQEARLNNDTHSVITRGQTYLRKARCSVELRVSARWSGSEVKIQSSMNSPFNAIAGTGDVICSLLRLKCQHGRNDAEWGYISQNHVEDAAVLAEDVFEISAHLEERFGPPIKHESGPTFGLPPLGHIHFTCTVGPLRWPIKLSENKIAGWTGWLHNRSHELWRCRGHCRKSCHK